MPAPSMMAWLAISADFLFEWPRVDDPTAVATIFLDLFFFGNLLPASLSDSKLTLSLVVFRGFRCRLVAVSSTQLGESINTLFGIFRLTMIHDPHDANSQHPRDGQCN